jgi:hypothetical protein
VSEPLAWRKSRRSADTGNCVEVASLPDGGYVLRDSKDAEGPVLEFSTEEWCCFTAYLRADHS